MKCIKRHVQVKPVMFDGGYATFSEAGVPGWHYFLCDHAGSVRVVADMWGRAEQINHYYPYGLTFADAGKAPDHQPFKFGGKELDAMYGLNLHDFHARLQIPDLGRFDRPDPLCEKTPHLSPYLFCANDPVNNTDPTGMVVIANNKREQQLLLYTLTPRDAAFVKFENGVINQSLMNSHSSESSNFNMLKEISNSDFEVNINISSGFEYKDDNGNIGYRSMGDIEYEHDFPDFSFKRCDGNITGETGFLGKTLLPGTGGGGQNSVDGNISVFVNQNLSTIGGAETLSHELYGHALIYVRTQDRKQSGHDTPTGAENNHYLEKTILKAREETIDNMNLWK